VAAKPQSIALGTPDRRLFIRRAPADGLTVRVNRKHVIYQPGETFQAAVGLNVIEPRDKQVTASVQWRLTAARGNRALAGHSFNVTANANSPHPAETPVALTLPDEEGVYTIRFTATGRGFDTAETAVQLVVLSEASPLNVGREIAGEKL